MCGMGSVRVGDDHRGARRLILAVTVGVSLAALCAAISEGAIALRILALHASTGDWDVRSIIVVAASLTLLVAGPVLAVAAATPLADASLPALPVAALATAAAVVARFFAYDSYYFPLHRRMSDGVLPGWWIVLVVALAVAAALIAFRNVRVSLMLAGAAMFLAGPTILIASTGH